MLHNLTGPDVEVVLRIALQDGWPLQRLRPKARTADLLRAPMRIRIGFLRRALRRVSTGSMARVFAWHAWAKFARGSSKPCMFRVKSVGA